MTDDFKTGGGMDALRGLGADNDKDPLVDRELGDYRVLRLIAEGGMGRVYLAERRDGSFERQVALKVAVGGAHSKLLRERFQTEQGVLASLNHPSIAQLYDAQISDEGWPYFVMEYVDGGPITDYCAERALSVRERIRLLIDVVDAVAFAHTRLIVHRDIKPSNVLVNAEGRPKLLDFGIAKLLESDADLTQATPMTPRYASPEQLLHEPITTAVDTYQLGLLTYEVLTGESLNADTTLTQAIDRARQKQAVEISSAARSELPGEVIRIIEHCLRADADDRYRDAGALRDDLNAYLDGYPVKAVGQSAAYRLKKAVRRNWLPVAMTALIIVGTTGALIQSTIQRNRLEATQATLEKVTEFQQDMLLSVDASEMGSGLADDIGAKLLDELGEAPESELHARVVRALDEVNFTDVSRESIDSNILAKAVATIDESFQDDPLVASELRVVVSEIYRSLGMLDRSEPLKERVVADLETELGPEHPETLAAMQKLGALYFEQGRYEESAALLERAYRAFLKANGPDDQDTVALQGDYGNLLIDLNRWDEAEAILVDALERSRRVYGATHWSTATVVTNLGYLYYIQGRYEDVVPLYEEALEIEKANYGAESPQAFVSASNLGVAYEEVGRIADAEKLYRETLAAQRRVQGDTHPATLRTMNNLAMNLKQQEQFEEAAAILRAAADNHAKALGAEHPNSIVFLSNYALTLNDLGRPDEAEPIFAELVERARAVLPPDHEITGVLLTRYGRTLGLQGDFEAAEVAMLEARRILVDVIGIEGARKNEYVQQLADLYEAWGRPEAKQAVLDEMVPEAD